MWPLGWFAEFLLLGFAPLSWLIRVNGGSKPTSRSVAILAGNLCVFLYHFMCFFSCFPIVGVRRFALNMFFVFFPLHPQFFFWGSWRFMASSTDITGTGSSHHCWCKKRFLVDPSIIWFGGSPDGGLIPVYFITMMSHYISGWCLIIRLYCRYNRCLFIISGGLEHGFYDFPYVGNVQQLNLCLRHCQVMRRFGRTNATWRLRGPLF